MASERPIPADRTHANLLADTHAHICDPDFDTDRAAILRRAGDAGIGPVLAMAETLEDARRNLELADEYSGSVLPCAGLYPTHLDDEDADAMVAFIREHRQRLVAIGEVGLDFWVVKEADQRERQRAIFRRFIDLANELDLPLSIHSRSAGRHAVAELLERDAQRVILHAFDGKAAKALPAVEAGYYFSIPPSIVRSHQKQKLVRRLPLSCLLLESDSPVLGPDPKQRNEPANAVIALEAIANLKGVAMEEVAEAVAYNTRELFGELS